MLLHKRCVVLGLGGVLAGSWAGLLTLFINVCYWENAGFRKSQLSAACGQDSTEVLWRSSLRGSRGL